MLMCPGYFQESLKVTWKAATKQSTPSGHHSWLLPCSLPVQLWLVLVPGCNDAPVGLTSAILMVPAENTNTDHPSPLATVLEGSQDGARIPEEAGRTDAPNSVLYHLLTLPLHLCPFS